MLRGVPIRNRASAVSDDRYVSDTIDSGGWARNDSEAVLPKRAFADGEVARQLSCALLFVVSRFVGADHGYAARYRPWNTKARLDAWRLAAFADRRHSQPRFVTTGRLSDVTGRAPPVGTGRLLRLDFHLSVSCGITSWSPRLWALFAAGQC